MPVAAAVVVLESVAIALPGVVVAVEAAAGIESVADSAEDAGLIVLAVGFVAVAIVAAVASADAVEYLIPLVDLELLPAVTEALLVEVALAEIDCFHYLDWQPAALPFAGQGDLVAPDAVAPVVDAVAAPVAVVAHG